MSLLIQLPKRDLYVSLLQNKHVFFNKLLLSTYYVLGTIATLMSETGIQLSGVEVRL